MPIVRDVLDCCCSVASEVRKCTAVACPSWPFRMGVNPFREKRISIGGAEAGSDREIGERQRVRLSPPSLVYRLGDFTSPGLLRRASSPFLQRD